MNKKTIVLTGGGTAGHVTPNLALVPELKELGCEVHYIGSRNGMEKELVGREGVPYHGIRAGKLRRYFDLKNFLDVLNIASGLVEAFFILLKLRPALVFSKGGFVSCPVVWAAWLLRIPVIIHESDMTPGLANRLSLPFASRILYSFAETGKHLPAGKAVYAGLPIRAFIKSGSRSKGLSLCKFTDGKPVVLFIGGSKGSEILNQSIRKAVPSLSGDFQICHICGQGNEDMTVDVSGYVQFGYVNEALPDLYAMSDLIVSRAGATTVFEILSLCKPALLIPLSRAASRGDQIENAESVSRQGLCGVVSQDGLNDKILSDSIRETYRQRLGYMEAMKSARIPDGTHKAIEQIRLFLKQS